MGWFNFNPVPAMKKLKKLRGPDGDRIARLFAADCAERALLRDRTLGREPPPRLWTAIETARRRARGEASATELEAAMRAAKIATTAVAMGSIDSARHANWTSAWDAARPDPLAAAKKASGRAATATAYCDGDMDAEYAWQNRRLELYLSGEDLPAVTLDER